MASLIKDYKLFLTDRMWRSFFTAWSLRNFAFGMIAVFSPIYFYTKGYGLGFICLFLGLQALANGLMRLPYANFLSRRKKDVRVPFAVSLLLLGVVYGAYAYFIDDKTVLLFIALIDGALQCALWSSYHYVFSAAQHHKHIGSQVGVMYDGSYISAIIAIALAGFIGQQFGLVYNFLIGAIVLLFAAILVLRSKISWPHRSRAIKQQHVNIKHIWRDALAGSSNIIDASIVAVLWPLLFVVFSFLNYTQVGLVVAAGLTASLLANLVFGRIADDVDRARILLDFGLFGTMLVYMLRLISISSGFGLIILNLLAQIVRGSVDVSYSVLFYRRLKKADSKIRYIATYETITGFALAAFFGVLWFVQYAGGSDKITLIIAFMIAITLTPLTRLIASDNFKEFK